jgi:hypothetical protein
MAWKFFKEIEFNDNSIILFNVDTRDFYVDTVINLNLDLDHNKLEYFLNDCDYFTGDEALKLLNRLYLGSGGEKKWRTLRLEDTGNNWRLKYLRIYRTPKGLVICDRNSIALRKNELNGKIIKD